MVMTIIKNKNAESKNIYNKNYIIEQVEHSPTKLKLRFYRAYRASRT